MVFLPRFEQNSVRLFCSKWYFYPISSKIACINASTYDSRCKHLRWSMQALAMADASAYDDRCKYLR